MPSIRGCLRDVRLRVLPGRHQERRPLRTRLRCPLPRLTQDDEALLGRMVHRAPKQLVAHEVSDVLALQPLLDRAQARLDLRAHADDVVGVCQTPVASKGLVADRDRLGQSAADHVELHLDDVRGIEVGGRPLRAQGLRTERERVGPASEGYPGHVGFIGRLQPARAFHLPPALGDRELGALDDARQLLPERVHVVVLHGLDDRLLVLRRAVQREHHLCLLGPVVHEDVREVRGRPALVDLHESLRVELRLLELALVDRDAEDPAERFGARLDVAASGERCQEAEHRGDGLAFGGAVLGGGDEQTQGVAEQGV